MRKTVDNEATGLAYSGVKCPACPAVLQAAVPVGGGPPSERAGLEQHWLVCHPEWPFKQRDAR